MTVYISPNPGKEQAADTARRAAQLLLMQGAVVLMRDGRLAAADLVVEDDLAVVLVGKAGKVKQVVVAVAGTAMQHEQRLLAVVFALADDLDVGLVAVVVHVPFLDGRRDDKLLGHSRSPFS